MERDLDIRLRDYAARPRPCTQALRSSRATSAAASASIICSHARELGQDELDSFIGETSNDRPLLPQVLKAHSG